MSDHIVQSDQDSDGMSGQFMHIHESVWMAHWNRTCYNPQTCKEDVSEAKQHHLLSSIKFKRLEAQSSPKYNLSQNHEVVSEMGTLSGNFLSKHQGNNLVKSYESLKKKTFAVSTFQHDMGSSSRMVSHGNNTGKFLAHPFFCRHENVNISNSVSESKELLEDMNQSHSLNSNYERKINQQPVFVGKDSDEIQNQSVTTRFIPNQMGPLDKTKSKSLFHNNKSVPRIPDCLHNSPSMGICSPFDALEGTSGAPPKFSQTTHHLLISKKTNINICEGGQTFRDSSFAINLKGKLFPKFLRFSPGFGFNSGKVAGLNRLGSSISSELREIFDDVRSSGLPLKGESSAETDMMDIDVLQKNYPLGVISSQTNQIINMGQVPSTSRVPIDSCGEDVGNGETRLPDMNEEPPALPASGRSVNDQETSSSRTQSLDVEDLVFHAEFPSNPKSSPFPSSDVGSEPNSRWVKRLKLSASFAHGTKSSEMIESSSSHEKVKIFGDIMRHGLTSSEPTIGKRPDKEQMDLDQVAMSLRNMEKSSSESTRQKIQDVTLNHPWIQRWCRHKGAVSPIQNCEVAAVVCDPQSMHATFDELPKRQFPSIAAMALMGKGTNSCETDGSLGGQQQLERRKSSCSNQFKIELP